MENQEVTELLDIVGPQVSFGLLMSIAFAGPLLFISYVLSDSSLLFEFKVNFAPEWLLDWMDCEVCHGFWLSAALCVGIFLSTHVGVVALSTLFSGLMLAFTLKGTMNS